MYIYILYCVYIYIDMGCWDKNTVVECWPPFSRWDLATHPATKIAAAERWQSHVLCNYWPRIHRRPTAGVFLWMVGWLNLDDRSSWIGISTELRQILFIGKVVGFVGAWLQLVYLIEACLTQVLHSTPRVETSCITKDPFQSVSSNRGWTKSYTSWDCENPATNYMIIVS